MRRCGNFRGGALHTARRSGVETRKQGTKYVDRLKGGVAGGPLPPLRGRPWREGLLVSSPVTKQDQ